MIKIAIGLFLIYILLVVMSAALFRYIWNGGFKGTEQEETWKSSLTKFSVGYFIGMSVIAIIILIINTFFNEV
jgi:hypothetical protein